jgi:hypothetical protein
MMPAHDGVRRDDCCDGVVGLPTDPLPLRGEASTLVVCQPQPTPAELLLQDTGLLDEIPR